MPIIENLTAGGSGKTPHTYYLLHHFTQRGLHCVFVEDMVEKVQAIER